jgi:hypothetical protein
MTKMNSTDEKKTGIYKKFNVSRVDHSSQEKHKDCQYFVLDWNHDPYSIPAARAYAEACQKEYLELAINLREFADYYEEVHQKKKQKLKIMIDDRLIQEYDFPLITKEQEVVIDYRINKISGESEFDIKIISIKEEK